MSDLLQAADAVIVLPFVDGADAAYSTLLGPSADGCSWVGDNAAVTLTEPTDPAAGVAFTVADLDGAAALLARRGAGVETSSPVRPGRWMSAHPALGIAAAPDGGGARLRLDHVVFTAASVDSAVAMFAGRLGMDLRLVREFGEVTQIFLRTSSVIVEVLVGLGDSADESIGFWGLAWDTPDIDVERQRLIDGGLAVSEVRSGRKPGTRVATVREPALGIATILISSQA